MKQKISVEDEVDAIRDKIYEQIKDMSPTEEIAYFHDNAVAVCKEFGIKIYSDAELDKSESTFAGK
ncbi:hypothetical protein AGMMS49546_10370 [Spirochaetia bacterium]|nr:hypothetical protein AGMMS49546_10370 [Spirochaetia bacterium]